MYSVGSVDGVWLLIEVDKEGRKVTGVFVAHDSTWLSCAARHPGARRKTQRVDDDSKADGVPQEDLEAGRSDTYDCTSNPLGEDTLSVLRRAETSKI